MDVRLQDLRYFAAVGELLSFTQAAERLQVSQPSLSRQIRLLEVALATRLVDRTHRQIALTSAGTELLATVREVLSRWDTAVSGLAASQETGRAVLRVGANTSIGRDLYRSSTGIFFEDYPHCRPELRVVPWADATAGLADCTTDVAFVWLPMPARDSLSFLTLLTEPRWVALSSNHRLADEEQINFVDITDDPFIALPPEAGPTRDFWLATDMRNGKPAKIAAVVANSDEKLEAIASGVGISLLAEGNVNIYSRPGLVCKPVVGLPPASLAIAWRRDDPSTETKAFVASCLKAAAVTR